MTALFDHLGAEERQLLQERANQLAHNTLHDDDTQEVQSLIVLQLNPERYGVPIERVQEIEPLRQNTPVPGLPGIWRGIVNLRGSMYPVLDLRRYLGLPSGEVKRHEQKIALLNGEKLRIGVLVDQVEEIKQIPLQHISSPPRLPDGMRPEAVAGVTPEMITVLDVEGLLSDPALNVGKEANDE